MDDRTLLNLRYVYPDIRVRFFRVLEDIIRATGRTIVVTEGLRSVESQALRYAQGRTSPGPIVTNALPGKSMHTFGLAFDVCFPGKDPYLEKDLKSGATWERFGVAVEAHGLRWGGRFVSVDRPHAHHLYGHSPDQLRGLYQLGGLPAVWASCDKVRGIAPASEWRAEYLPAKEVLP